VRYKDPYGRLVIAGDPQTFCAYPTLLAQMSSEARRRIAQLEKSDLVYVISVTTSRTTMVFDGSGNVDVFVRGGYTDWTASGATIGYTDAAALAHELAGHGHQREVGSQRGTAAGLSESEIADRMNAAYSTSAHFRMQMEQDAFNVAGETFTEQLQRIYRNCPECL
jgi:hypothetical protein